MMKTMPSLAILMLALAAPATAQQFSASHLAAAHDVLEASQMRNVMETSMEAMLQMQIEQNPNLRELESVMRAFFERFVSWERTKDEYARLYAAQFTESELRDISAFYRTRTGRKLAVVTPILTVEGGRLGERLVQENLPELQRMIREHFDQADN